MDISNRGNRLLPDLSFVTVDGDFNCSNNNLTSLENMPQFIGGAFYCNDNQLTSLKGGPKKVGGVFNCRSNQLRSLDGAPRKFEMLWSDFGIFSCGNEAPEFLCGWSETAGNKALVKKYLPPNPGSR